MNNTAKTALEIIRDKADESRSKDGSMTLHSIANTLEQEINDLHRLLAEAKLDATRYAFLRNLPGNPELLAMLNTINADPETPDEFDAVIDAAIAKTLEVFK